MKTAIALVLFAACTDTQAPITGTTSLEVTLTTPTNIGDVNNRIDATIHDVVVNVQAKDANGNDDSTFNNQVGMYVYYLGTLTPYLDSAPTASFKMTGGVATGQHLTLPAVFGPTQIWLDDHMDANATFATGVSPTLWYRDPFVADIQTPASEVGNAAFDDSPLEGKNVSVNTSKHGATGKLVVTSVFAQGYTLADVNCPTGAAPCIADSYDYVEIFSYSAPTDQDANFISEGQTIQGFAGGISEFDGLTEIGFPQTFVAADSIVDKTLEPPVQVIDATWFGSNKINFERNEAGAIEVDNGVVCPLDSDYTTYKQWKVDPSGVGDAAACGSENLINLITSGVVDLDPGTLVGMKVPRIVGILRPVNIGSFNVWIIYPRGAADITVN
jgi:hypothetical protein